MRTAPISMPGKRNCCIFAVGGNALTAAGKALAISKDNFLARFVLARIHQDRGDLKQADGEFRWFVPSTTASAAMPDKEMTDPDELLLVGLAGAENARWHNLRGPVQVPC